MPRLSYEDRLAKAEHPLLKKLLRIIIEKRTNLCVAANFNTWEETIEAVKRIGQHICILKTQILRFDDKSGSKCMELYNLKKQFNFLLFEDSKLNDDEETVRVIYRDSYAKYFDLVTVSPFWGEGDAVFKGIIRAVNDCKKHLPEDEFRGCLAVCDVSFANCEPEVSKAMFQKALRYPEICIGIISQQLRIPGEISMIKAVPGVNLSKSSDGHSQRWNSPSKVINDGADIVIVGRGITEAPLDELEQVACNYKEVAFEAYCEISGSKV